MQHVSYLQTKFVSGHSQHAFRDSKGLAGPSPTNEQADPPVKSLASKAYNSTGSVIATCVHFAFYPRKGGES